MSTPLPSLSRTSLNPNISSVPPVHLKTPQHSTSASQPQLEGLENAGRLVDQHLKEDASFMELSGKLRIASHGMLMAIRKMHLKIFILGGDSK